MATRRIQRLGIETAFSIAEEAKEMESSGLQIFRFHVGDLNIPTPQSIIDATIRALKDGCTNYSPASGIPALKSAIASKINRSHHLNYKSDNVSVQPGSKSIIGKYIAAMVEEGDIVLVPYPGYPIYVSQLEFYGAKIVPYRFINKNGDYFINFADIEVGVKQGAKHIFFNDYHNPTGCSSSLKELEKLARIVIHYNMFLISDEAYFYTTYDHTTPTSIASLPGMSTRTLIMYTFSKTFAMTGFRLGAAIGPLYVIDAINRMNASIESCTTTFVQYAGIAALRCPSDHLNVIIDTLRERRNLLVNMLNTIETLEVTPPVAGFYVFVNVTSLMEKTGFDDVETFRIEILENTGVAVCTNHHFCYTSNKSFMRFAFSGISKDNIHMGITEFKNWTDKKIIERKNWLIQF